MTQIKIIVALMLLSGSVMSYGQVKIKDGSMPTDNTLPGADAILELSSAKKGVLFPRLLLSYTDSAAPLSAHTQGMVIYNIATVHDVKPGLYMNDGRKWQPLGSSQPGITTTTTTTTTTPASDSLVDGKLFLKVGGKMFYSGFLPNSSGKSLLNAGTTRPFQLSGLITIDAWADGIKPKDAVHSYIYPAVTNNTDSSISYMLTYCSAGHHGEGEDPKYGSNQSSPCGPGPIIKEKNPSGTLLLPKKSFAPDQKGVFYNYGTPSISSNELTWYYLQFLNPNTNQWESYEIKFWANASTDGDFLSPAVYPDMPSYLQVNISVERLR